MCGFFLAYQTKAETIGIEYDERIYQSTFENQKNVVSREKTKFVMARAEMGQVKNRAYLSPNPFTNTI